MVRPSSIRARLAVARNALVGAPAPVIIRLLKGIIRQARLRVATLVAIVSGLLAAGGSAEKAAATPPLNGG